VLTALRRAESYLRGQLAESLSLRFVPELTFYVDETEARGRHIDELLDRIAISTHLQDEP
jgi:ribosome-binding factor A